MLLHTAFPPWLLLILPFFYYLIPYLRNRALRDIPGPRLAAFSNLWLLYHCRRGRRYLAVHEAHKKYGPLVRIQPNHVSIADAEAIPVIYSHSGGWLKRFATRNVRQHLVLILTDQRILRCLCLHPPRPLQHARPSRAYQEAQIDIPHLQRKERRTL